MKKLSNIGKHLVSALFIISGLIKLNDPVGTSIKLEEYFYAFSGDISPFFELFIPISLFLSLVLCSLEFILGVALLFNYRMKTTVSLLLTVILFFTFLTFYSAYFNKVTDCGCFGDAIKLTPWQSFGKDIVLLFFVVILFFRKGDFKEIIFIKAVDIAMLFTLVFSFLISLSSIRHLPFIDFRAYKVGANIPDLMKTSEPLRYQYVMEKNGGIHVFKEYPRDSSFHFVDMKLLNPEAQPKITDLNIWNDSGNFTEELLTSKKVLIIIHNTLKASEKNMDAIKNLIEDCDEEVWILTSSNYDKIEAFRHQHQLAAPAYFGDETVLKTMIRSNPGIIVLNNGVVLKKWHCNDTPSAHEFKALF